jgi:DNA replication protein DnaC
MAPLKDAERRDFLEICDDRYQRRSTVLTSQVPVEHWHEQIGDPTVADSILDRLVNNTFRIDLNGESMRQPRSGKSGSTAAEGLSSAERGQEDSNAVPLPRTPCL